MSVFLQRCGSSVMGMVSGFDRVRLRGTLRWLCYRDGLGKHLSKLRVLLKEFGDYAESLTKRICSATKAVAEAAGRPMQYLASPAANKEEIARGIAERDGIREGLICVLSAVEPCRSFGVHPNAATQQIELRSELRKCLHYYHYWMHPQWGFMHVRVQTWLPFTLHVCLNGREWLARQMDGEGLAYQRRENCFVWLADVAAAQRLLDQQLCVDWARRLDALLPQVHPEHARIFAGCPSGYYWSVDQSEWASDVLFRTPAALAALYPRLIRHGVQNLGSREVLRFLGRRVPTQGGVPAGFQGQVVSDLRERPEGLRIKHRLNRNSIKMYDKQGSVLRIETTIDDPRDLRVYRPKEGDPDGPKDWRPMRKAVADVHRRAQVCQAANERYLESLASVGEKKPLGELAGKLCQPVKWKGGRVRALNPLAPEDARLLEAVARGEFAINGFRNRDLRARLYPASDDPQQTRKQAAAVTRRLRMLRAHRLIRKVAHTQRYVLSPQGRTAITALVTARSADTSTLLGAA